MNWRSITNRVILLGVVMVTLATAGRIYLLGNYLRQDLTTQTTTQLVTVANYVAQDIDHDLIERREFLTRVADRLPLALLADQLPLESWLEERQHISALFSQGMFVMDAHGQLLSSNPELADSVSNRLATQDFFSQALAGKFAIGRPVVGKTSGKPVLPMAWPLRDPDGLVKGVLVGVSALKSPNFLNALHVIRVGTTGGLVLVSPRDGLFLGASDADIALKPTPAVGLHPQHDQAMNGFRGSGIGVNALGVEELTSIVSIPSSGWFVVARLPTAEAFAPVERLQRFIVTNTVGMMLVFVAVLVFALRYLLRPLRHTALHADRMTQGELPLEPLPVIRDDEVGHVVVAFNRVLAKLMESRSDLEHMAHHDKLTGLPNRQLLADRMTRAFARAQRAPAQVAVLFLDLDGFKPINDRLGHEAGDLVLREVARRLLAAVRNVDTVARVGGDEFVIFLSELDAGAADTVERVADKCLQALMAPVMVDGEACQLGVSIGLALGDGQSVAPVLLKAAGDAMDRAKKAGRGCFVWSPPAV